MKKYIISLLIIVTFSVVNSPSSQAQSFELVAGNSLNGAMNGVLLGGATMALQNSEAYDPVRVGLGAGTLYGIGVGVYDLTQVKTGQQFYKSGTFNDGTNSSILVLLDTIYGAAGGAVIATSAALVLKNPLDKAVQYGAGAGAWAGFGFGLIDTFVLAEGPNFSKEKEKKSASSVQHDVSGLMTYSNASRSVEIGVLKPEMVKQKKLTKQSVKTTYSPALNILELQVDF